MSSVKSVVISCAGIGSRLGLGLTKALVQINGRSLISWQLELFKDVEDIRIVIGFQANDIIEENIDKMLSLFSIIDILRRRLGQVFILEPAMPIARY